MLSGVPEARLQADIEENFNFSFYTKADLLVMGASDFGAGIRY